MKREAGVPTGGAAEALRFRVAMSVTEVLILPGRGRDRAGYYLCPRCAVPLERDFAAFCDRCGQRLDWRGCRRARKIYPDP